MAIIETGGSPLPADPAVITSDQPASYHELEPDYYERLRKLVTARFEQAEQASRSQFEKILRWEKLVHMITKKKAYDWKANVSLPYPFAVSEQSSAMKWLALFTSQPIVTCLSRSGGRIPELQEIAERRQSLVEWRLTAGGDIDCLETTPDMIRMSERYGTAVGLVAPRWDKRTLRYRSPEELPTAMGPLTRLVWKTKTTTDYRIGLTPLDLLDCYPQPNFRDINGPRGMRYMQRKFYLTMDELRELEQSGLMGPAVGGRPVDAIQDASHPDLDEFKQRRLYREREDIYAEERDQYDRTVELIEYQGQVPREMVPPEFAGIEEANGLDPYNRLIVLGNKHTVLENIALPWDHKMKSYVKMDCVADPHDFWGKGKIEPNEHLTYAANEIVNMRLDNVKQLVNALIAVYGSKMPARWKSRLVSQPFGIIETNGPISEVIGRVQTGDVTGSAYQEQSQFWTLIQEAGAVNETMIGGPGPSRTLGEHQLKAESASKRLQFELQLQAKQLLLPPNGLTSFVIGLDSQYLSIPTYLSVINPNTPDGFTETEVDPQMFQHEDQKFRYVATGATEGVNQQSRRAEWGMMVQSLQPYVPYLLQMGMDLTEFVKQTVKLFGFEPARLFPGTVPGQAYDPAVAAGNAAAGGGMPGPPGMPQGGPMGPGGGPPNALQNAMGRLYGQ